MKTTLFLIILLCFVAFGEEEEGGSNLPPVNSSGFNFEVEIWEMDDTLLFASDEAFIFDISSVEVTDSTGRFVLLKSLEPPAKAQLLVTENNNKQLVASRIRITELMNFEGNDDEEDNSRSLQELATDNSKRTPATSKKAVYGTSKENK